MSWDSLDCIMFSLSYSVMQLRLHAIQTCCIQSRLHGNNAYVAQCNRDVTTQYRLHVKVQGQANIYLFIQRHQKSTDSLAEKLANKVYNIYIIYIRTSTSVSKKYTQRFNSLLLRTSRRRQRKNCKLQQIAGLHKTAWFIHAHACTRVHSACKRKLTKHAQTGLTFIYAASHRYARKHAAKAHHRPSSSAALNQ